MVADAERLAHEAARENPIVEQWLREESLSPQEREEMYAFEAYEQAVDEGVGKPAILLEPAPKAEAELAVA